MMQFASSKIIQSEVRIKHCAWYTSACLHGVRHAWNFSCDISNAMAATDLQKNIENSGAVRKRKLHHCFFAYHF